MTLRLPAIWWVCLCAIAILVLNAARSVPQIAHLVMTGDGDDLMRLQQVRDWLEGQAWFDTRQYRVLPPDGISMHWSRYVDLGIASLLVPLSSILPLPQAELAVMILWPTLLGCLAVLVIGHGVNRLMGPVAAIGALATFLTWSKLGGEFAPGRIDHHNVQILCATAAFHLALVPGRPVVRGALSGACTALALAVGLEMLPFLALAWGMVVLRHAFGEAVTGRWLVAFCAAFALVAPLLLAGQVPVSGWWVAHCDVLATPVLGLAAVGIAATLAQVALGRGLAGPWARLAVSAAVTACGLWLAAPLLSPCLAGPYAQAADEVRRIIESRIIEALPASVLIRSQPGLLAQVLLPPVVITVLALGAARAMRGRIGRPLALALAQSVAVVLAGLAFALVQIRAANLMTPALPVLGGFLAHAFATIPRDSRLRGPAMLGLLLALPAVIETGSRAIVARVPPAPEEADAGPAATGAAYCRTETALAEIASLPKSVVFVSLNLGPAVIAYTPQATTSAAYHRSLPAYWNGIGAFQDPEKMRAALAQSGADYLVTCIGAEDDRLVTGMGPRPWLEEMTGPRREVRVFRVIKAALPAEGAAP